MKGGGCTARQSRLHQPAYAQLPPRVQVRKRDGDGYNGVKARLGALHNRSRPPLSGIPGSQEGIWNHGTEPPSHHTGGVWSGPLAVWALGHLLGLSTGGSKTEKLPLTGLLYHKGCSTGRTCIPYAAQHGGG